MTRMFSTYLESATMCLERFVSKLAFGLAALAIVAALGFTVDHLPAINALAQ
jgi:hypothetical protein